jgi:hypothetical protein
MTDEFEDIGDGVEEIPSIAIEPSQPAEQKPVDVSDIDASWDGTGSLDEHRQKAFAKVKQPGFGDIGKVKSDGE